MAAFPQPFFLFSTFKKKCIFARLLQEEQKPVHILYGWSSIFSKENPILQILKNNVRVR